MIEVHMKEQLQLIRFQITDTSGPPILGLQAARQLDYVNFPEIKKPTLDIRKHTAIHSIKNALEVPAQRITTNMIQRRVMTIKFSTNNTVYS
jgi:hypothetical protein